LPGDTRRYVERIEALVDVPVEILSVGPGRDETIVRAEPFRSA
jgi:adenylosuccinate synthase